MPTEFTPGVRFDHVWKKFRRGEIHDSLRDLIPAMGRRLRRGRVTSNELEAREFWALRDISFTVEPGEALGIIGANGAGKSTVLKTLNRILRPTSGIAEVRGRAGALIEVSAGFHLDLTGAQNIYLQGAIMGMKKMEIARKFEEIVEFSGIRDFIDTPVKRYSSGMNARLGFSIAAHLDPDVLIIDEVLAVGDLSFQERAFGRIREMVTSGIPVVIVSHQLERIATLCTKAILLEKGQVKKTGTAEDCIAEYVLKPSVAGDAGMDEDAPVQIRYLEATGEQPVRSGDRITFRMGGSVGPGAGGRFDPYNIYVRSAQTGKMIFGVRGANVGLPCPPEGEFEIEFDLQLNVPAGIYAIETHIRELRSNRRLGGGPVSYVQVVDGQWFDGSVQLNPEFRALSGTGI